MHILLACFYWVLVILNATSKIEMYQGHPQANYDIAMHGGYSVFWQANFKEAGKVHRT